MKLHPYGIEWGGPKSDWYYFYPRPNWLMPKHRYIGIERLWYDGPHVSFGFWFFNISWSTRWSKPPKEMRK